MKDILLKLAAYNMWANDKITYCLLQQDENLCYQQIPSSFQNIYKTVLHMWDAESIWWQRMKLQERIVIPSENLELTFKDACNGLMQQSMQWEEWVKSATDMSLEHVFSYYNSKKELFKQPVSEVLLHIFNHGTYHRGQLVNMLRQLGAVQIPQTDFIVFSRNK